MNLKVAPLPHRRKFHVTLLILIFLFPLSSLAQHGNRTDSIRNAATQKRKIDSLNRATKKMELMKQRDSVMTARKQQRVQDSILRIQKAKRMKDSIDLLRFRQQYGEEKYQRKLIELDRLKKQEGRFIQQRKEDSLLSVKKQREQFVHDSEEEYRRNMDRQLFMKDSIEKARVQKMKKEKEKEEKRALEIQRRKTKDSLESSRRQQIKDGKAEIKRLVLGRKKTKDSLAAVEKQLENGAREDYHKKPTDIEVLTEDNQETIPSSLPPTQIDSLRRVDSMKFVYGSFRYRLKRATELSAYFGVSNYLGDLGGNSGFGKKLFYDNNFKKRNFFYGVSLTHSRGEAIGFRFSYITGKISASDQDIAFTSYTDPAYRRYKRNLDFETKISEWSLTTEVYLFKLFSTNRAVFHSRFQPYLIGGIGRFSFNPQGSYYDEIAEDYLFIDLQPLHTEGQGMSEYPDRKPYSLRQWNLPYGVGVKYVFSRRTSISFEYVGRKLFTDYLDDVSTTYIDPNLFSKYLGADDALIAKQVSNKSNLVSPDHYFREGEDRGCSKHYDFYYSFNIRFSFRISKLQ